MKRLAVFSGICLLLISPLLSCSHATIVNGTPIFTSSQAGATLTALPSTVSPTQVFLVFNFDDASPPLLRQGTPFDQTSGEVKAHFSSAFDPGGFSIQNHDTNFFNLSQFSGSYLCDSSPYRNALTIRFNRPLASISLSFATVDYHDPGTSATPTEIKLTAFVDSTQNPALVSVTGHGTFSNDSFPQGKITANPLQPFNLVTLELPFIPQGAVDFFVDNIEVTVWH
jgi:hypothetical protein